MLRVSFYFFFTLLTINLFGQRPSIDQLKNWETEADTLMSQEDFAGAVKIYTRIIDGTNLKQRPDFNALYKRAVCYYRSGELDLALSDMNRFIPEFPYVHQAFILRALLYREMNDDLKQLEDLNKVLALQPSNPGLLKWRASVYLNTEEYEKAKADALEARLLEDDPEVEAYLGFAYYNLGSADSAMIALNRAIELDPTYLAAYLYAGSFCLQEEDYDLALRYISLALRIDDQNPTAIFYKGIALVEREQVDEGCQCLNRAFYMGIDDASGYLEQYCYSVED